MRILSVAVSSICVGVCLMLPRSASAECRFQWAEVGSVLVRTQVANATVSPAVLPSSFSAIAFNVESGAPVEIDDVHIQTTKGVIDRAGQLGMKNNSWTEAIAVSDRLQHVQSIAFRYRKLASSAAPIVITVYGRQLIVTGNGCK